MLCVCLWVLVCEFYYKNAQPFDFSILFVIYWLELPHVIILDPNKTQIETKNKQDLIRCSPKLSCYKLTHLKFCSVNVNSEFPALDIAN